MQEKLINPSVKKRKKKKVAILNPEIQSKGNLKQRVLWGCSL